MLLTVHEYGNSAGGKPDVVLIHGTGADASLWQPQIDLLVEHGHRCIVPELRGHGGTHEPGESTPLDLHIEDILETLAATGIRYPALWVGHSLGAILSMVLAEDRPELFTQVVAVSMPGRVPKPVSVIFRFLTTWPFAAVKGSFVHRRLPKREKILIDTELFSLQQIVHNFATVNFVERTPNVTCPVHFSVGRLDVVAPWVHVRTMHQNLPHSTFRVFDWAGHCCMDDQPEQFQEWFRDKILSDPAVRQVQQEESACAPRTPAT